MRTAYIHELPTGNWAVTGSDLPYLDERTIGYRSRREAIKSIRDRGDYTHYLTPKNKKVKL